MAIERLNLQQKNIQNSILRSEAIMKGDQIEILQKYS